MKFKSIKMLRSINGLRNVVGDSHSGDTLWQCYYCIWGFIVQVESLPWCWGHLFKFHSSN